MGLTAPTPRGYRHLRRPRPPVCPPALTTTGTADSEVSCERGSSDPAYGHWTSRPRTSRSRAAWRNRTARGLLQHPRGVPSRARWGHELGSARTSAATDRGAISDGFPQLGRRDRRVRPGILPSPDLTANARVDQRRNLVHHPPTGPPVRGPLRWRDWRPARRHLAPVHRFSPVALAISRKLIAPDSYSP